ncbi:MAG: DUF4397 domain-containing protein [Deltaproteobacteria bacterium]
MRKIALIAVVAFAAACGSSSPTPTGYLRVANLSPEVAAIDFCVAPTGGTYSSPVMANAGETTGLKYDVGVAVGAAGLKQMSKYFGYGPGTYDIKIMSKAAGGSCANPLATLTGIVLADGGHKTIGFVGTSSAGSDAPLAAVAFTDEVSATSTTVAIRFVNGTLTPTGVATPAFMKGIAWNVGISLTGGSAPLLTNIIYPSVAQSGTLVDANGYAIIPTGTLPTGSITLYVCPYPFTPENVVAPARCGTFLVPGAQISGGIVASAYMIGGVGVTAGPLAQTALFCGDVTSGQITSDGNYSACAAGLQ